ncbi:MAG: S9 family peptidase [Mycobacteriales bacterium]
MRPEDVWSLVTIGDVQVSPTGKQVAFTVSLPEEQTNGYRSQLWLVDVDGQSGPLPVTAGENRDRSPRWSPAGDRFAFVSHHSDSGSEIRILPLGGGESSRLLHVSGEVEEVCRSPDGRHLAFSCRGLDPARGPDVKEADQPPRRVTRLRHRSELEGWVTDRPKHVFVVPMHGGPSRQITDGPFDHDGLAWSPDGTRLAFASARHDDRDVEYTTELYSCAADGLDPRQLTTRQAVCAAPTWSPDGLRLAYFISPASTDHVGHRIVEVLTVADGTSVALTDGMDRNVSPQNTTIWQDDGLLFGVEDHGGVHLYRVATDGSAAPVLLRGGESAVGAFHAAAGTLAYVSSDGTNPAELWVQTLNGVRRLTGFHDELLVTRRMAPVERFVAHNSAGQEVDAWLVRPDLPDTQRVPVLLSIHGGPYSQYGDFFHDEFQVYAGAGYAVLYANPRGSSGYSASWAQEICGPDSLTPGGGWGEPAMDDLMSVVDTALARYGFLDASRLGVLGGSYGGYLTSWIVGHTNRFAAAISERAVNNLVSFSWTSDVALFLRSYLGVSYLDDPDQYVAWSPTTYVRSIETPLLILHSENDLRCPISQAEEMFTALRLLNKQVEFVRFPAEGHELSRSGSPSHRIQRFKVILEWFARHLQDGGARSHP